MMMKNYGQSVKIYNSPNWPYIPDHPSRILITGGSGSEKTNVFVINLIKYQQPDIDKSCLYVKDSFESKYQFVINRRNKKRIKKLTNPKPFIDHSQTVDDVYEIWKPLIQQRKIV